ncbi:hypothetical protein QFZ31_006719 [Neobacillus niacini]|uniref:hypothetical protein n=1 Tax=Neobacillus driksii TaxID=3035913 RepID=UPI00277FFFB5|nr:hypothetical protein [Neobacillus niacini]MDQ0976667.1 hypothetical protein [Neobacillus niacini]
MRYDVENPMVRPLEKDVYKVVAYCCNCDGELHIDEDFLATEDNEYLCDETCLVQYMGVRKVEGWEI